MTPLKVFRIRMPIPARTAADGPLPPPEYYRASDWFSTTAADTLYDIVMVEPYEVQPYVPLACRRW